MTLTLDETFGAIRALDTEEDIIEQACKRYLRREREVEDNEDLARLILNEFMDDYDTADIMAALAIACGYLGATITKPGASQKMLRALQTGVARSYTAVLAFRVERDMKRDPEKAISMMIEMLEEQRAVEKRRSERKKP